MKQLGILFISLGIWAGILIASCGSIEDNKPTPNPEPSPTPSASISPENPLCTQDLLAFGPTTGNLWKPVSDTIWSFAFVIDSRFIKEFTQCSIELKNGTWHELECFKNDGTCFANGNRQHWKTKLPLEKVKNKPKILCQEAKQECLFQVPCNKNQRCE